MTRTTYRVRVELIEVVIEMVDFGKTTENIIDAADVAPLEPRRQDKAEGMYEAAVAAAKRSA